MGDKILGMYVTRALLDVHKEASSTQSLARRLSIKVSNAFLAKQAKCILPQFNKHSHTLEFMSDWRIATITEAAVAEVYEESSEAVRDLASYLIHASSPVSENLCPKIQVLLEDSFGAVKYIVQTTAINLCHMRS
jgi:dsRNA-specific ribonuclease